MTKSEYIKQHPKSYLAEALTSSNWPDDTEINVIGGLIAPDNKTSNLCSALEASKLKDYVVGGHRYRGTEGWWMAVA